MELRLTRQARKVLAFLTAKGLLRSEAIQPNASGKLTVDDFLRTAEEREPRVLAVLPAALIHFPRSFLDFDRAPAPLPEILEAIISGKEDGPSLFHVPYKEMKRWANAKLKDKRAKPVEERKVRKTYRFARDVAKRLSRASGKANVTETSLIEKLVRENL